MQHPPAPNDVSMRWKVVAAAVGNFLEFYDFILFAVFARAIARAFFPASAPSTATMLTFATFGVAAVTRPLGAIVIGAYADRRGRKAALTVTILVMAASTTGIGLLPGYRTIGVAAPMMLVALRLAQGFSAGGEFGGATAFLAEHAPNRWRGYYAGWLQTGTFGSAILASGLGLAVLRGGAAGTEGWTWRLPFLLGSVLAPLGFYIRRRLPESETFRSGNHQGSVSPLRQVLIAQPGRLLVMIGAVLPATVGSYLVLLYWPHWAQEHLGLSPEASLVGGMIASLISAALCPVAGALSDRVGRRRLMFAAMLASALLTYPLFAGMTRTASVAQILALHAGLGALLAFYAGPMTALGAELFATGGRSTGLSIGYGFAAATFGNFTPLLLSWGIVATHDVLLPAEYLIAATLVGAVAVACAPNRTGMSLRDGATPEATHG